MKLCQRISPFSTHSFLAMCSIMHISGYNSQKIMSILYKLNMHIDLHFFQDLHFAFVAEKTCKSIRTSAIIF